MYESFLDPVAMSFTNGVLLNIDGVDAMYTVNAELVCSGFFVRKDAIGQEI